MSASAPVTPPAGTCAASAGTPEAAIAARALADLAARITRLERTFALDDLADLLARIAEADRAGDYRTRNPLVVAAVAQALRAGMTAGFRIDPAEPAWPVAFIELETPDGTPVGQVTWHLPQHPVPWDGHSTGVKAARVQRYLDHARGPAAQGAP